MRRGHPRIGGWRNDNPRHFRPRIGGTPHFRPSRGYEMLETPRFPPPGPRPFQGAPYNPHHGPKNDRNRYLVDNRHNTQTRPQDRQHYGQRQIFPLMQRMRHGDVPDHGNQYKETPNYYDDTNKKQSHNNMGDVDHRQKTIPQNRDFHQQPPPWINPPFSHKPYRHHEDVNKMPVQDYTGHRPPASDHYGGNPGSNIDNSNSFSCSVDDTVNIVRKRLQSRDSQFPSEPPQNEEGENQIKPIETISSYSNVHQDPPKKKTPHRQGQNVKSNCDKLKNKIVDQLFMMDKDKIRKLMDHPNSSTKFEYAISSLVTESQNSFNRHLRSVAEKSLCSSSTDFIHNDNNTIYEDTFMKQMQCILDPQDTVLLEDIKPMVLAELSKVLQLDEFDQRFEVDETAFPREDLSNLIQYPNEYNYDDCFALNTYSPGGDSAYFEQNPPQYDIENADMQASNNESNHNSASKQEQFDIKQLFQRRQSRKSCDYVEESRSNSENRRKEKSFEKRSSVEEPFKRSVTPRPLFDGTAEYFSGDNDPFAELDKQYHVAIDHNFLGTDDLGMSPHHPVSSRTISVKQETFSNFNTPEKHGYKNKTHDTKTPHIPQFEMKKEFNSQLQDQDIPKSPLKLSSLPQDKCRDEPKSNQPADSEQNDGSKSHSDHSVVQTSLSLKQSESEHMMLDNTEVKQDKQPEPIVIVEKMETCNKNKPSTPSYSRKRSTDQRTSHRKEKRKKSESSQCDGNKQILNKNIIINVNDCAAKSSESCDNPKSIFNLFFSKEKTDKEVSKESSKADSVDKNYSDKYVKRKETPSKSKDRESDAKKKHDSSSSSHSMLSPTDNSNTNSINQYPTKTDAKAKLKPIDMFGDQLKKSSCITALPVQRNTAPLPSATNKTNMEKIKSSGTHFSRKVSRRHMATQVTRKSVAKETQTLENKSSVSRFCQTERKKLTTRGSQTNPVSIRSEVVTKSTDTFERMKEIDIEIQVLLQEKFKLYSSLESNQSYPNTMQSLGMAVLNVTPSENTDVDQTGGSMEADAIVEEFTNIPVEELEQIALECIDVESNQSPDIVQKKQRIKGENSDRKISTNPASTKSAKSKKKSKTGYISSLIEQIITDERPLEDIISLDELEDPPDKPLQKSKKPQQLKKKTQIITDERPLEDIISLDELEDPLYKPIKKSKKLQNRKKKIRIITEERPLDEIISLEELEVPPDKPLKKSKKPQQPKKKTKKKAQKITKHVSVKSIEDYGLNECFVLLQREDLSRYLQTKIIEQREINIPCEPDEVTKPGSSIIEESVVNDIQFDMLDVSEDIVIGDNCEIKSEDKNTSERVDLSISEEIILDNSQSSMEDTAGTDTGQTGNECKMFDFSSDENLRRDSISVTGNGDAVLAIESIENNFIAACVDGNVYHFSGDGQLLNTLRGSNLAVTCLTIVKEKYGTTVYTGSLDSRIRYYDLDTGLEKGPECNVLSPIQTMDRAWDTIFVGTKTGFVLQFECKNNMLIPVSTVKFSEQSILALRAMKEGPRKVLLVGARSEGVTIKDAQTGLLLRTLGGPKMTIYSLLFEDGKVYCGTSTHQIHVYDYASGSHVSVHEGGKGAVCLRAMGGLLFAGCYDGCVYVYCEGEPRPRAQLRGPAHMLLSLAIHGSKIIAGYNDRSLYIWKIPLSILQEIIL